VTQDRNLALAGAPLGQDRRTLAAEALHGLRDRPKRLPPKLFYDERGTALFEEICRQPEYDLWRGELEILTSQGSTIARLLGPRTALIDLGSGAGDKSRRLLRALEAPAAYVPVDIAGDQLARLTGQVRASHPHLHVRPVLADYSRPFTIPSLPSSSRRVAYYPGSTIGNFHEVEAVAFLDRLRRLVCPDGGVLLGVDRVKDRATLEAAYDDAQGVTAAFNLNVLARLNRELGADFDLSLFRHVAFYDEGARRVEMHLESLVEQTVTVAGAEVRLEAGERIWTESSYKYDGEALERLATGSGLRISRLFSDDRERFWLAWLLPM
jgi:dimethylhistidine N-methyltransferase